MSREIKFRGLTIGGFWAYGLLSKSFGLQGQPSEGFYISNSAGMPWAYAVRPETVGQLVGHKDKNGVEIYEGDILLADNNQKYIVIWIDQICGFYLSLPNTHRGKEFISCAASKSDGPITLHTHEVIGNIYQNP